MPELDPECRSLWQSVADALASEGSAAVTDVSVPHFKYGVPCYNIINCAEATSNMAKYSGLIFGKDRLVLVLLFPLFIPYPDHLYLLHVIAAMFVNNLFSFVFLPGRTNGSADSKTVNELFARNRVAGLGPVVQHRIIAGMYFLSYQ